MTIGIPGPRDPRTFVRWFLDQEAQTGGIVVRRAELCLCRAVELLERDRSREALAAANDAVALDPSVRAEALVVARMCVRREVEEMRRAFREG